MKIALGSDHRGTEAAKDLRPHLESKGHTVELVGECNGRMCDYPDNAWLVGRAVVNGDCEMGILICGTGIGMCIAANKVDGVRAALVSDELTAELSRAHNNANVLCLSGDLMGQRLIQRVVDTWLATPFEAGRHERRVSKIMAIERGEDPTRIQADAATA